MCPAKNKGSSTLPWVNTESLQWGEAKDPVRRLNQAFASIFCPSPLEAQQLQEQKAEGTKRLEPLPWADI
jgi:hypothetical protein